MGRKGKRYYPWKQRGIPSKKEMPFVKGEQKKSAGEKSQQRFVQKMRETPMTLEELGGHATDLRNAIHEAEIKIPGLREKQKELQLKRLAMMKTWLANTEKAISESK